MTVNGEQREEEEVFLPFVTRAGKLRANFQLGMPAYGDRAGYSLSGHAVAVDIDRIGRQRVLDLQPLPYPT